VTQQSLIRITEEVLLTLLRRINDSVEKPATIVMQFDALDGVSHRLLRVDESSGPLDANSGATKFQDPHHALHADLFLPLLTNAAVFCSCRCINHATVA
jgi:hypothetical protein